MDSITEFLESCRQRKSPRTLAKYRHDWTCYWRYGGGPADQWRSNALDQGLAPKTIESVLSTVKLIQAFFERPWEVGERLKIPHPQPDVPTAEQVSKLYQNVGVALWPDRLDDLARSKWWMTWIVVAAWTGFRLGDLRRLTWDSTERLSNTAGKTGKRIDVPTVPTVERHLAMAPGSLRMTSSNHQLYRELRRISDAAEVPYVSPQKFRRYAVQQWTAADSRAGEIIHGRSLGVLAHYLDAYRHLETVSANVKLPDSFLSDGERRANSDSESELIRRYRMAPSERKRIILDVSRLA